MTTLNLTETIQLSTEISQELFLCNTKESVEKVFEKFNITGIPDKIGLLHLCMGVKYYSYAPSDDTLTLDQQYEDTLIVFTEGSWRFLI